MAKYRKLIVATIGLALMALDQFFNFSVAFNAEQVVNVMIPILTAFGVWGASNE